MRREAPEWIHRIKAVYDVEVDSSMLLKISTLTKLKQFTAQYGILSRDHVSRGGASTGTG
jgi:hypothetical protein